MKVCDLRPSAQLRMCSVHRPIMTCLTSEVTQSAHALANGVVDTRKECGHGVQVLRLGITTKCEVTK